MYFAFVEGNIQPILQNISNFIIISNVNPGMHAQRRHGLFHKPHQRACITRVANDGPPQFWCVWPIRGLLWLFWMAMVDAQCMHEQHVDLLSLTWSSVLLILINALTFNTMLDVAIFYCENAFAVTFQHYIVCSTFNSYAHFLHICKSSIY